METETHKDLVVKAIKELKKSLAKSMVSSEWSMEHILLCYRGKVYVPKTDLRQKIFALCHDSKIAGHPGRWKTLELVSWNYWWPQMSRYTGKYVSVRGPNDSFGNQTGRTSNSSKTTEAKRHGSRTTRV